MQKSYDIIIIGSGLGGGTMLRALSGSNLKILLIERGDFIPQEPDNWDGKAVFRDQRYTTIENWDHQNLKFFYCVGGGSKVYGAAMQRLRKEDFGELVHYEGVSPAWPITYEDLEPYYTRADRLYSVHGDSTFDPTEPPHSNTYPFPPVPHEPAIQRLQKGLTRLGLSPYPLPEAVDFRPGGKCIRCATCDGYPCKNAAKGDSDICCVRPALMDSNVKILTNCYARRLIADKTGRRIDAVEIDRSGERVRLTANLFVVSCGAINSALLLLRSRCDTHPHGLANFSGQVGRNLMTHNGGIIFCFDLWHSNRDKFQKTLGLNDFYLKGRHWDYPMGNVQLWGKLSPYFIKELAPKMPLWKIRAMLSRSLAFGVQSEDLPDPENRIFLDESGNPVIRWKPNNLAALNKLLEIMKSVLKKCGYTKVVTATSYRKDLAMIPQVAHQMGTIRFGNDPHTSVLNSDCRAHDVENLFVVDGSFFPSSAAVNPGLTIAAQSLRVAAFIRKHLCGNSPAFEF